jgi:hypothetical protein
MQIGTNYANEIRRMEMTHLCIVPMYFKYVYVPMYVQ